jgi:hypothetical protein
MTSKKLGNLLRSVPPAIATERPEPPPEPVAASAPAPVVIAERKPPRPQPAAEPEVPLQVLVPKSIRKQLGVKAAEEGETLRALILRAVRGIGITVTDEQIAGKRGRREA